MDWSRFPGHFENNRPLKRFEKKAELQSEMENDHGKRKAVTAFRPLC